MSLSADKLDAPVYIGGNDYIWRIPMFGGNAPATGSPAHSPVDAGERIILVSEANRAVGSAEKLNAHCEGLLHRAFSIFLIDDQGRLLLQQRHPEKYHSGGLWANTCCGHPRPGESTRVAAVRRLQEEMGVSADLTFRFHARYRAALGGGMYENELVYLYFGRIRHRPAPHPGEISAIDFISLDALARQCVSEPASIAVWLRHYLANHGQALRWAVSEALIAQP